MAEAHVIGFQSLLDLSVIAILWAQPDTAGFMPSSRWGLRTWWACLWGLPGSGTCPVYRSRHGGSASRNRIHGLSDRSHARSREQIDLEVMVNPHRYLITPDFGILLVMPALTTLSIYGMPASKAAKPSGSWDSTAPEFRVHPHLHGGPRLDDQQHQRLHLLAEDLPGFPQRLQQANQAQGVGSATNRAVVTAAVICVMLNYIISNSPMPNPFLHTL